MPGARFRLCVLGLLAALTVAGLGAPASAQAPDLPSSNEPPSDSHPLWVLTGDMGAFGEAYRMSGRESRRPNETGRLFLRPTLTIGNRYTIRSEALLSTEGSSALARHSLNQLMVNPSWSWRDTRYSARLGDFSDSYTPTSFNGVLVRGAELAVQRQRFNVAVLGGRTKPALEGGADAGSYRQTLFAGRAEYGTDTRGASAFVLYAADDPGSLPELPDTAGAVDSTEVGTVVNPYSVTPQENLVVSAWGHLDLWNRQLSLAGELSRSNYTGDRRAANLASGAVDYAVNAKALYRRRFFELTGGYKRIGPGYVSLGVASMHSDQQEFLGGGAFQFGPRVSWRLQVSRQNDNLSDQKDATTVRYRYVTGLSLRPSRIWVVTLSGNHVTMANHTASDSARVDFGAWILGMNHNIALGRGSPVQTVSLGYTAQFSGDDNPLRANSDVTSHTATAVAVIRILPNLNASPTLGFTAVHTNMQDWRNTTTYGLAFQHSGLRSKLSTTLSASLSSAAGDNALTGMLGSRYSFTRVDALDLRIQMNTFRRADGSAGDSDYDEWTSRLGWTRRF